MTTYRYAVRSHKDVFLVIKFDTQPEASAYLQSNNDPNLYVEEILIQPPKVEPIVRKESPLDKKLSAIFDTGVWLIAAGLIFALFIWLLSGVPAIPLAIVVGALIIAAAIKSR